MLPSGSWRGSGKGAKSTEGHWDVNAVVPLSAHDFTDEINAVPEPPSRDPRQDGAAGSSSAAAIGPAGGAVVDVPAGPSSRRPPAVSFSGATDEGFIKAVRPGGSAVPRADVTSASGSLKALDIDIPRETIAPMNVEVPPGSQKSLARISEGFGKSFTALRSMTQILTDDDPGVVDKWHALKQDLLSGTFNESKSSLQRSSTLKDTLLEMGRSNKLILKNYGQAMLYSMFTAALITPMVYALSKLPWHIKNPPGVQPVFDLNKPTFELSLIFQCIFPLSLYALILYACIKSTWKIPKVLLIFTCVSVSISTMVAVLFWHYNVPFWYYSGDFIYIALSYVPNMCIVGWYLADEEGSTTRDRIHDLLLVAVLETMVASAALIYCMYMMPLFFMLSAWGQLAWMMIIHPVYFEITTAFILRVVLRRNAVKGRNNVLWCLSIVHAAVHSVSISAILTSSIDKFGVTILTQTLCSATRLIWRSTTNLRDIWIERTLKWNFSYEYPPEESMIQNRLVAVGIQTEMILENASNVLAPWMIWCTWHVPLFMSVAPDLLIQGGEYPVYYVIGLIACLIAVTALFDIAFLFFNYHGWQELPVIQTWREIRKAGWWYFGFLTYALTFMGFMFLFITMIIVPRWTFCNSNNYCDCRLPTLQGICDGQYISTWGGNIVR